MNGNCERTGQTYTCDQYASSVEVLKEFLIKEYDHYRMCQYTNKDEIIQTIFNQFIRESKLIGSTILYPDNAQLITTMKFLDFSEPYTGTYTGYLLINLEMLQNPIKLYDRYEIYPTFRKRPMFTNYTLPEPNYDIVKLPWEHYTVRYLNDY